MFFGHCHVNFIGVVSHQRSEFITAGVHPKCESDHFAAMFSLPSWGWLLAWWPVSLLSLRCFSSSSHLLMKLWALSHHVKMGREKKEVGKGSGEAVWGRPLKLALCIMTTCGSCPDCWQCSLGCLLPPPLHLWPVAYDSFLLSRRKLASGQDFLTPHSQYPLRLMFFLQTP